MNKVSAVDLNIFGDYIIIDIRSNYYYNNGHIDGAINIPYYNLLNNYSHYLDKNHKYYLYCDYGEQSEEVANRLSLFGYNVYSLDGGYLEYKNKLGKY